MSQYLRECPFCGAAQVTHDPGVYLLVSGGRDRMEDWAGYACWTLFVNGHLVRQPLDCLRAERLLLLRKLRGGKTDETRSDVPAGKFGGDDPYPVRVWVYRDDGDDAES